MMRMGLGFITKVPSSFSGKIRDDIINSAITGTMDDAGRMQVYDTDARIDDLDDDINTDLRMIAYRLPNSASESEAFLREHGLNDMVKKLTSLRRNAYFCEDDAKKAFSETMMKGYGQAYAADAAYETDKRLIKKDPNGPHWRIRPGNVTVNETKIKECAERYSVNVLATNLPRAEYNSVNLRNGANAEGVVKMYLDRFVIEHAFKLMKSGTGVGHMFIHTPSRQDAVVFLSSLATMVSNTADAVMRRSSVLNGTTMKHVSDFMITTLVKYDRGNDEKYISGGPGATETALRIVDALGIDPELLLGH
jgi:transposase